MADRWIVAGPTCYKITGTIGDTIHSVLERGGDTPKWIGREFTWTKAELRQGIASGTVQIVAMLPAAPVPAQGTFVAGSGGKRTKKERKA